MPDNAASLSPRRQDGHLRYRPELDGLRALAVLAVIFFHADPAWLPGGFIGVDVFFVISGYLITTLLLGELSLGQFSLARFYERRARRILPALFIVLTTCLVASFFMMLPGALDDFAKSLIAVPLFISNVYFWSAHGYFDATTAIKPLLHTWSLGIEEQYYLAFPLLLAFFWRGGRQQVFWFLLLATLLSLGFSEYGWRFRPMANFYLIPFRAWELLSGSLLALAAFNKPLHERLDNWAEFHASAFVANVGLLMIGTSFALFDKTTPFPSLLGLFPILGAVFVIGFCRKGSLATRILSHKILVSIGLVSYSAYLWHHPLFAFARIISLNVVPWEASLVLIALTFGVAFLSWHFIEKPFRRRTAFSRREILSFALFFSLFFISIGAALLFVSRDQVTSDPLRPTYGLSLACDFGDTFTPLAACRTADEPETLVWGDSLAMALPLALLASNPQASLVQATRSACGPLLGLATPSRDRQYTKAWADSCLQFNQSVISYLARQKSIETVVLATSFTRYVNGQDFTFLTPSGAQDVSADYALARLRQTIGVIHSLGKRVVLIAPPPTDGVNYGACHTRQETGRLMIGGAESCTLSLAAYHQATLEEQAFLQSIEKQGLMPVLRFDPFLCSTSSCATHAGKIGLYQDEQHLSFDGAAYLGKTMGLDALIHARAN